MYKSCKHPMKPTFTSVVLLDELFLRVRNMGSQKNFNSHANTQKN